MNKTQIKETKRSISLKTVFSIIVVCFFLFDLLTLRGVIGNNAYGSLFERGYKTFHLKIYALENNSSNLPKKMYEAQLYGPIMGNANTGAGLFGRNHWGVYLV